MYCPKSNIDLCVSCFADQSEPKDHKSTDPYHVINKLNFPMFSNDWSAEEELLLFEGLERYGFGNW